jgi:hypothetical protein
MIWAVFRAIDAIMPGQIDRLSLDRKHSSNQVTQPKNSSAHTIPKCCWAAALLLYTAADSSLSLGTRAEGACVIPEKPLLR